MTKILIVDDNATDRYMLYVLLTSHGCEVITAAHGAEALRAARQDRPDIIIADIMMPEMDGFALCREWKKDFQLQDIPFVFYTATFTDPRDEKFALSLGADRFIVKPTEPDEFIGILLEVIRQSEAGHLVAQWETEEETVYLKKYNAALIRKLENKLVELEEANRALKRNITRREQVETALRRSEKRYRDLYDNAPYGYCVVDPEGLIRDMNATQLNWLGYSHAEIVDRIKLEDLVIPAEAHQILQLLKPGRSEGRLTNVEQTLVCKDNRRLSVFLNLRAIQDDAGQCTGYYVTTRDISKEKILETQLLQAQKLESLGKLTGGIAHDFNNILSGILGFSQLLLQKVDPGDRIYKDIQQIEALSHRAADMIGQLMTFSRRGKSQKRSLDLCQLIKEITKLLERIIPENIQIELKLKEGKLNVEADPTQLQQVIMNLAVNARDAMPEGGGLVIEAARVELDDLYCQGQPDLQPGWYALLKVSDTGVGIPQLTLPYIFDPFFTTKVMGKGTGLGLPVVYGIVKNHGGTIEVESLLEHGTTMKIYLPLSQQPIAEAATVPAELCTGTETLLLVEDEPMLLEFGKTALRSLGYSVLTARNGVDALKVFEQHRDEIALVILDMIMPHMGGREAAGELKRMKPEVALLLTSGYDSLGKAGEEMGAYEFLRKPYRIHDLAQAVRTALKHRPQEHPS